MECELCGRNAQLVKVEIEGTYLSVCPSCSRLGRVTEVRVELHERQPGRIDQSAINPNFPKIVRNTRASKGFTVDELAAKLVEKASVLERIEHGMRPTDALARKLQRALGIKLLGHEEVSVSLNKPAEQGSRLGDVAVIRKRKK